MNPNDDMLTTKEVAKVLRRSDWYLKRLRTLKNGPPYYKIGKSVLYKRSDVIAWAEAARVPA